jgi:RNA polymerase sigma factor (sigma-70 family)
VLRNRADAEDAFQAAFWVLARKASSVRKRASIGGWLYRVAHHIALKAKLNAKRQQTLDRKAAVGSPADPQAEAAEREMWAVLDEELSRLPEKFRAPLVLCYLEGRTHAQAAQELGYRPGSMSWRLARGQQLLQARLVRRGLVLPAAMLSTLLLRESAVARAAGLIGCVSEAALLSCLNSPTVAGAMSANVALLTKGALHAMWITKMKVAAVLTLAVMVLGAGGGMIAYRALAAEPQATSQETKPAPPTRAKPSRDRRDDELKSALDRVAALEKKLADYQVLVDKLKADLAVAHDESMQAHQAPKRAVNQATPPEVRFDPFSTEPLPPERIKTASEAERRLRAEAAQQVQDEIELLEAQLEAKQAELRAAHAMVEAAKLEAARVSDLVKKGLSSQGELGRMQQDMAAREAQVLLKRAEMKEPEIRLKQARRRLAALQGSRDQPGRGDLGQRVRELEEKVMAMDRDLARLKQVVRPE